MTISTQENSVPITLKTITKVRKIRKSYSAEVKLEVIGLFEQTRCVKKVSSMTQISISTIKEWVQKKDRIVECHRNPEARSLLRRRKDFDNAFKFQLIEWIDVQRARGIDITYSYLQRNAEIIRIDNGYQTECTISWLRVFVRKHNIKLRTCNANFWMNNCNDININLGDFLNFDLILD